MKFIFWLSVLDLLVNGDPIKRGLRMLSKRTQNNGLKFAIGAVYGNLSLYGYTGVGKMMFQELKGAIAHGRHKNL